MEKLTKLQNTVKVKTNNWKAKIKWKKAMHT